MKVHWTLPDYLQRSARHLASKTDLEQAMAVGKAAVQYALAGRNATMPVIVRTSDAPYRWKIEAAPLAKIANREKKMRSEEHTSELQSLMRNSYAVFCLKKKRKNIKQ